MVPSLCPDCGSSMQQPTTGFSLTETGIYRTKRYECSSCDLYVVVARHHVTKQVTV